jgi:hypothetical protein
MLNVTRTGSASSIAADMRQVAGMRVPTVAAKALTFTAQKAQAGILRAMGSVFEGGATAYTLGSTRIEPASVDKLSARVAVKDRTTNSGTLPENYLFPQVFGGQRREKRFERALRYGGLLRAGERAVLGARAKLNAQGNQHIGELRALLNAVAGTKRGDAPAKGRNASKRSAKRLGSVFVGTPGGVGRLPGVYRRVGKGRDSKLEPLLVFVTKKPTFRKRLDFEGIAQAEAQREFPAIFNRLLAKAGG